MLGEIWGWGLQGTFDPKFPVNGAEQIYKSLKEAVSTTHPTWFIEGCIRTSEAETSYTKHGPFNVAADGET